MGINKYELLIGDNGYLFCNNIRVDEDKFFQYKFFNEIIEIKELLKDVLNK